MELIPAVQKYHWGKPGKTSTVANLYSEALKSAGESPTIDAEGPYAELWMGTHPNGPSKLKGCNKSLLEFIKDNPTSIGEKVKAQFGMDDIPFLLKVLSVESALSIQAHPDKPSAEILHRDRPDLYKDPNHKPEMAIALTPFEMFCGFRAMDEIVEFLQGVPELREIVGDDVVNAVAEEKDKASLRMAYTRLMESQEDVIKANLTKLLARLKSMGKNVPLQ
ncbi:unnamed protein product [Orchesella dallaii]|uniref:mannose-6-phosphate isomerase n=1 Tax=Orchesella dallaii TaxID=48710 RepID=A0ABP1QM48_9HEXA